MSLKMVSSLKSQMQSTRKLHQGSGAARIAALIIFVILGTMLLLLAEPESESEPEKNPLLSQRSDGLRDLMELASRQDRFYALNSRYTDDISSKKGLNLGRTVSSTGHYDLIARAGACGNISNCYTLEAVPRGAQNEDIDCGTLSVDSLGTRNATGLQGTNCW
ncbi:MAG: type IV pilin protein [Halioglobus sp.]|nr:type IV pilin protein [Halioglobus sp.]